MLIDLSATKKSVTQSGLIDRNPQKIVEIPTEAPAPKVKKTTPEKPIKKKEAAAHVGTPVATPTPAPAPVPVPAPAPVTKPTGSDDDKKAAMKERMAKLRAMKKKPETATAPASTEVPVEKPKRTTKKKVEKADTI